MADETHETQPRDDFQPFNEDEIRALVRRVVREELARDYEDNALLTAIERLLITRRAYSGVRSVHD